MQMYLETSTALQILAQMVSSVLVVISRILFSIKLQPQESCYRGYGLSADIMLGSLGLLLLNSGGYFHTVQSFFGRKNYTNPFPFEKNSPILKKKKKKKKAMVPN